MLAASKLPRCCLSAALLALLLVGCASSLTTVKMPVFRPAEVNVGGLRRLAFAGFTGNEQAAAVAQQTLVEQMQRNGFYQFVGAAELQQAAPAPLLDHKGRLNKPVAVEAGRRCRMDLLLAGRARFHDDCGADFGGATVRIGDPTLTAEIEFDLVDLRTGQVLLSDRVTSSFRGDYDRFEVDSSARQRIYERVARQAAEQVLPKIAPHKIELEVPLAGSAFTVGSAETRDGIKLARGGEWNAAIREWHAVVDANRANHAAMFNLGVGYEALGDFGRARQFYQMAAQLDDSEKYAAALERVEKTDQNHQLAMRQLQPPAPRFPPPGPQNRFPPQFAQPAPQFPVRTASANPPIDNPAFALPQAAAPPATGVNRSLLPAGPPAPTYWR